MDNLITGTVKLFPAVGKIKEGSYVLLPDGSTHIVNEIKKDIIVLNNNEEVSYYDCKLLKFYVINNKEIAEIHFEDYEVAADNFEKQIQVETFSILAPSFIGDQVKLIKIDSTTAKTIGIKPMLGVIISISENQYSISLPSGSVVVKRHYFVNQSRVNYKYIGRIKHGISSGRDNQT